MSNVRTIRTRMAHRRAQRRDRLELERQLAAYDTPSARLEIEAILERHSPEQTRELRAALRRHRSRRVFS